MLSWIIRLVAVIPASLGVLMTSGSICSARVGVCRASYCDGENCKNNALHIRCSLKVRAFQSAKGNAVFPQFQEPSAVPVSPGLFPSAEPQEWEWANG